MKKNIIIAGVIALFVFLFPTQTFAAELYMGSSSKEQGLENQFAVGVFVNTQEESVNAFEGELVFSPDELELKDVLIGDSVVNFWVEQPNKDVECTDVCRLKFSGITPGGYFGDQGRLFSAIFESKKTGTSNLSIENGKVLLNDGEGTEAPLVSSPIELDIVEGSSVPEFKYPFDPDPPESFVPYVGQDKEILDNKIFLVFTAQDKLSGVDHYEVAEKRGEEVKEYNKLDWKKAESPYLLKDQSLTSFIYVKAVDGAGNSRIEIIPPQKTVSLFRKYALYGIIILLLIIFTCIFWVKYGRKNKKSDNLQ